MSEPPTNRIGMLRTMAGMSLAAVADRLGVTENTVRRWESGAIRTIPDEQKLALAQMFEVSVAFLLGWPDHDGENGDNGERQAA